MPIHRCKPTTKRYIGATVFIDHHSDFTYTHLMTELNAQSTTEAKHEFDRIAKSHDCIIKNYHAKSWVFDTKIFKGSIERLDQTLSFCGVNANHQNGKAKNRIKDITNGSRTALIVHAAHRWPKAIHSSLWLAALKTYVNVRNNVPTTFIPEARNPLDNRKRINITLDSSPLSKFSTVKTTISVRDFHRSGSPVYALDKNLKEKQ